MFAKKIWIPVVLILIGVAIGITFGEQRAVSQESTDILGEVQVKGQKIVVPEYPLLITYEKHLEYLRTTPPDKIYVRTRDTYIKNHYYQYPNCTEHEALLVDAERYAKRYITDLELKKKEMAVWVKWEKEIQKEILSFDYEAFVKLRESSTDDGENALVAKYDYWAQKHEAMDKRIEEIQKQGSTAPPKPSHTHQTKEHTPTTEEPVDVSESTSESQQNFSDNDIGSAEAQDTSQGILQARQLPTYPLFVQVQGQTFILPTYPNLLTGKVAKEYLESTTPEDTLIHLRYMYIARHYNKYPNCTEHDTLLVDAINYAERYMAYMEYVGKSEAVQKELEQARREYDGYTLLFSNSQELLRRFQNMTKKEKMEDIAKMNTARKKWKAAYEKQKEVDSRDKPKLLPLTHRHTLPIDVYTSPLKTPQNPLGDYRHITGRYSKRHFRKYPDCQEYEAIFKDARREALLYLADQKWVEELQAAYTEIKNLHREDDDQVAYLSSIVNPSESLTDEERAAFIAKIENWQKRYNAANMKYEEIEKQRPIFQAKHKH